MDKELIIEKLFQQAPKNWKEKIDTYAKVIEEIDLQSPIVYLDNNPEIIKDLFNECNALAFEKSLEMVISYCKVSEIGKKNVKLELKLIIEKCFLSTKSQIRSYGIDILIILSEKYCIDVVEILLENILSNKRSIVNGILETLMIMIKQVKKLQIKDIIKQIPNVIDARDKLTRDLAKKLAIEICTYYGRNRIEPCLKDIKPVLLSELQSEFDKVIENVNISVIESEDCKLPVDLLSHISTDMYEKIDGSRQERKEVLEKLNEVIDNSPLINGNYRELIRKLCQIFTKDSQIASVILAGKLLTQIANGLKKNFSTYSSMLVESCFEKFKEKKPQVLSVTRECIDAAFMTTNLENCLEGILKSLENKNPTIRVETISFLLRITENLQVISSLKKNFKRLMPCLRKLCDDNDVKVREEVFQLIGKIICIVGEKNIKPFLEKLDSTKLQIINSITSKSVPGNQISNNDNNDAAASASIPTIQPLHKIISSEDLLNHVKDNIFKKPVKLIKPFKEMLLSESDLLEKYLQYFGKEVTDKLVSQVWKFRLEACDKVLEFVKSNQIDRMLCQVIVQFTFRKPGLKDSNIQVVKKKLQILNESFLKCENRLSMIVVDLCLNDIIERMGDVKLGAQVKETLSIICLNTTPNEPVFTNCVHCLSKCKSTKSVSDCLGWFVQFLTDNKFKCLSVKEMLPSIQQLLQSQNAVIKQLVVSLIVLLRLDYGEFVSKYFESEKPNIVDMINKEIKKREKLNNEKDFLNQNKITKPDNYEEKIYNIHKDEVTKLTSVQSDAGASSSVHRTIMELSVVETIGGHQHSQPNSYTADKSVNNDFSSRDVRDNCRSFVLDLCEKLNFYTSCYSNSIFQEELGLFLSSMKPICDPLKKSAINILYQAIKSSWIESEGVSTQTEFKEMKSLDKPIVNINVPVRMNEYINSRKKLKVETEVNENSDDIKENNYENPIYEKRSSELTVLRERTNSCADKYINVAEKIIFVLGNETSPLTIYENLSRLKRLLKDESRLHILHLVPQLLMALIKRSKANEASYTFASTIQELQQILTLIGMIYSEQQFIDAISHTVLRDLYHQLFTIFVRFTSESSPAELSLKKLLSCLLLEITTKTNTTESLCAMISLLSDSFSDCSIGNQYISVLIKNTAKIFDLIKSSDMEIDFRRILLLINDPFEMFLNDRDKMNSISLKTIKTIIDFLTKIKKLELLKHVPENNGENLISYIHKCHKRITQK